MKSIFRDERIIGGAVGSMLAAFGAVDKRRQRGE
jgi:hypothetical protein